MLPGASSSRYHSAKEKLPSDDEAATDYLLLALFWTTWVTWHAATGGTVWSGLVTAALGGTLAAYWYFRFWSR